MSGSTQTDAWTTGWTADDPLQIQYNYVGHDEGAWQGDSATGLERRELGLSAATDGLMGAHHIRAIGGVAPGDGEWRARDLDFHWFYVLKGQMSVETADGRHVTLGVGGAAYQPPFWWYRPYDLSADLEVLEITGPATPDTIVGRETPLPPRAAELPALTATYLDDTPDAYVRSAGPRAYFEYRDHQTRVPTDGRIHLHTVRAATEPMTGGTGEHHHTMSQWFMPISGWADITVDGQPDRRMVAGDFMCIAQGLHHDVTAYSADYATLEMCVPAEYDTVSDD